MTALAFVDIETTGLDPDLHEVWEVAAILADHDAQACTLTITEQLHMDLPVTLATAEPMALQIGGYYTRRTFEKQTLPGVSAPHAEAAAALLAYSLAGRHLVGANPAFDAAFLSRLLRAHGHAPAWPHHLIDVSPLVAGYLQGIGQAQHAGGQTADRHGDLIDTGVPPYRSRDLAEAIDVKVTEDDRHTALGDARWALDQYATVYGLEVIDHVA